MFYINKTNNGNIIHKFSSFGGGSGTDVQNSETINIFSVASGHLYERLLRIMMLSLLKNTKVPIENLISISTIIITNQISVSRQVLVPQELPFAPIHRLPAAHGARIWIPVRTGSI